MRRSDMERDCTGAFGKGKNDRKPNESESNFNVRFLYGTRSRKRGFGFIA